MPLRSRARNARAYRKNSLKIGMLSGAVNVAKNLYPGLKAGYKFAKKAYSFYTSGRKSIHQAAINLGTGGSMSKFYYGKRKLPRKIPIKQLSKNYQVLNSGFRLTATPGIQTLGLAGSYFGVTDVGTLMTEVSANKTQKLILQSVTSEQIYQNQDLGNVRLIIYDIIARRDLTSTNISDPIAAWTHSYADQGGANADYVIVGTTPFSSDLFTQFFKVLKATHVVLAQGQSHVHRVHFQPNRIIDEEYVQYETYGMKGLTCFTMAVAYGSAYNDSVTKTSATVTTGNVAIDVVTRRQYKFSYLSNSITKWVTSNALPGSFAVAEDLVDIGSGTVAVDANA